MIQSKKSWTKIINSYQRSGLAKAEFYKKQNLRPNQFYYWCNKLRPDLKSELDSIKAKEALFLPIKTTKKESSFSITINSRLKIEFESLPEPLWIAKLLNSVGELNDQH
jgi:hypothetical protein